MTDDGIPKCLISFAQQLWLEQCFKLTEVKAALSTEASDDESLKWLPFVTFLGSQCSGAYTDKQWSELLNLMQISRRLNHRTVKFGDLLTNRNSIELNTSKIRQFNEAIQSAKLIEGLLTRLDPLLAKCHLSLPDELCQLKKQVDVCKIQMQDHCQPIMAALRVELASQLVVNHSNRELWLARFDQFERQYGKLSTFLSNLSEFELRMDQLRPLVNVKQTKPDPSSVAIAASKLNSSLELCKQKFANAHSYRDKLLDCLRKRYATANDLALTKLLAIPTIKDLFSVELAARLQDLADCQLGLNKIMQTLRLEFGRFYFLSDLELLEIISLDTRLLLKPSTRRESERSRHLISKIFGNSISSLLMNPDDSNTVTGIESPHGEKLYFHASEPPTLLKKKINIFSLEIIRIFLETSWKLRRTLRRLVAESLTKQTDQIDWLLPIQLLTLTEQIKFCEKVEQTLSSSFDIEKSVEFYQQRLDQLKNDASADPVPDSGNQLMQLKKSASISMTVQFLSTLNELKSSKVSSASDWHWLKQLRFQRSQVYSDKQETQFAVKVLIANMSFYYKFDYLPLHNTDKLQFKRLISTEVTQRCLLAACHSICHLRLGASPFGPAGSGKTETVKALGHSLGCQVIVHNCDQSNDAESLNRLVWGLAQTGLWGCFDEFNRLSLASLSSVSANLELVQSSIREEKRSVELPDGTIMPLDPDSAFFITLNPIDKKLRYKGRRRLPSNLRGLFQPISMVRIPIDSIIAESLMLLSGFEVNIGAYRQAASRLHLWLQQMATAGFEDGLCEWDLRLVVAILKRIQVSSDNNINKQPLDAAIMDSVKAEVRPRFAKADWNRMQAILEQTFGVISSADKPSSSEADDDKISALASQLETRIGVLLLGPAKSGKSHTWRQLLKRGDPDAIDWTAMNPRACGPSELLGRVEQGESQKWIDGLLPARVREALAKLAERPQLKQFWLVFDGPVDPDWIESLNSVLDDNQVLTLGSGERLGFVPNANQSIKLIIETDSIELASPATISRLGLVLHPTPYSAATSEPDRRTKLQIVEGSNIDANAYNCSQLSNSSHLQRLFDKLKDSKHIFISNLDTIEPENQWGSRSFIELLRYSITYQGLHEQITVSVKDSAHIDQRMLSLADQVTKLPANVPGKPYIAVKLEDIDLSIEQRVVILRDDSYNFCRREEFRKLLAQNFEIIHEFRNSKLAGEAMADLNKLFDSNVMSSPKNGPLFFITWLELSIMPNEVKSELYHSTSLLAMDSNHKAKIFLYLPNRDVPDANELFFSTLVDQKYMVKNQHHACKLEEIVKLDGRQLNWLQTKLASINDVQQEASVEATFPTLYSIFSDKLTRQKQILTNGLARLLNFGQHVVRISAICERDETKLKAKQLEVDMLMLNIDQSIRDSEDRRTKAESLSKLSSSKEDQIKTKRATVELELAVVRPLLESSKQEVNQHLRPEALNEIKAMRSPPKTVKDVLDVLFVFLGILDSSWQSIKGYLTRNSLKDELNNYDFRNRLTANLLRKVELELDQRKDSFNLQQAARASKAIVPIVHWIQAALKFGRVMLKLKPLELELQTMKVEQDELEEAKKSTERQLAEIKAKREDLSKKLDELRRDHTKAKSEVGAVRAKLNKATQVQRDLEGQTTRWKDKLKQVEFMLEIHQDSSQLLKLSLFASMLHHFGSFSEHELLKWTRFCDLSELATVVDQLYQLSMETELSESVKPENMSRMVELLMVKICLIVDQLVPLIDIGHGEEQLDWHYVETMLNTVTSSDVSLVELGPDCFGTIELAISLNKVVIIKLDNNINSKQLELDLIDHIFEMRRRNRSGLNGKLILLGDLRSHSQICSKGAAPLSVMKLTSLHRSQLNPEQLRVSILNWLIAIEDSDLSSNVQKLEAELSIKRNALVARELTLIERLANTGESTQQVDELDLDRGLVTTLAELHDLNERSKRDVQKLETELQELSLKKNSYSKMAEQAASFYSDHLAGLGKEDGFCRISLDNFLEMLRLDGDGKIDFSFIAKNVLRPMKPTERMLFIRNSGSSNIATIELDAINQNELQLEQAIEELRALTAARLMIALHDPSKSSPQLELDDLLRNSTSDKICYHKLYATGDNDSHLEAKLRELDAYSFLCIANAHLALGWINSTLVHIIKSQQFKCMLILIAEADESLQFEPEVLALCKIRFWYDELASSLEKRFELLLRSARTARRFESLFLNQAHANLASYLILFHVVCQERTKIDETIGAPLGWSIASYRFDHDQLMSAIDMLFRLSREVGANIEALGLQLSNYVSDVIYGPRMETKADELELERMAHMFLEISSGKLKMEQLGSLANKHDNKKLLIDLISN